MPRKQPTPEELTKYIDARIREEGECWVWTGPLDTVQRGDADPLVWPVLGLAGVTGRHVRRAIYQLVFPTADLTGQRVKWRGSPCHLLCVRPSHLIAEEWPKRSDKYADDTPNSTPGPLTRSTET